MKLYCTIALQEKLGVKYAPAPPPTDLLDSWYAHVLPGAQGKSTVLVTLTGLQFCVIIPDIGKDQWADLDQRIVSAIQDALQSYHIPPEIMERHLPWFTKLNRRGATTGSAAARVIAMANQVRKLLRREQDPKKVMDLINSPSAGYAPAQALLMHLERKAPIAEALDGSAMELECSLDLMKYKARRTLIVPTNITFRALHNCLQVAYRWHDCHLYEFTLPPNAHRDLLTRVEVDDPDGLDAMWGFGPDNDAEDADNPGEKTCKDHETRLQDLLQEGDIFQYLYDFGDSWEIICKVTRYIPDYQGDLPVCTLLEGKAPPEDVGGVPGYLDFLDTIANPKHPDYQDTMEWIDRSWFDDLPKEAISMQLQTRDIFQP